MCTNFKTYHHKFFIGDKTSLNIASYWQYVAFLRDNWQAAENEHMYECEGAQLICLGIS